MDDPIPASVAAYNGYDLRVPRRLVMLNTLRRKESRLASNEVRGRVKRGAPYQLCPEGKRWIILGVVLGPTIWLVQKAFPRKGLLNLN